MKDNGLRPTEAQLMSVLRHGVVYLANGSRFHRRLMAILIDAALCVFSVWLALSLRLGYWDLGSRTAIILIAVALPSWFVVAWLCGVYRTIIRSAGNRTMFGLGWACFLMSMPMSVFFLFVGIQGIPRTMGILQPIIFLVLLVGFHKKITGETIFVYISNCIYELEHTNFVL